MMIHVGENKERWEGWTKCEQFIGLGRLKGFVNYPGLICHHMMFAMG